MELESDDECLDPVFNYRVYTNEQRSYSDLDWSKLQFNDLYKSYESFQNKFPKGYENIVGFDKIIEYMVNMNIDNSPLKELENKLLCECNNITNE